MKSSDMTHQLEVIMRGAVDLVSKEELIAKLHKGKPLRVKAGFDPTSPDLHLGHTVLMHKLKQFQDLGHHVIFLIGDFTARIGDPSGRDEMRPPLSDADIAKNAKTYTHQAFHMLDRKKTEVRWNSEWLGKMKATDLIRLASRSTVSRMLERDDFKKRYASNISISIHEFLYPLLQGEDSVALHADVEIGGTDQIFNLLVGRELLKDAGKEPQVVLTLPLLVGTDGIKKMSKSLGNAIGITESERDIFGKVMSLPDNVMWEYYKLLSDCSSEEIAQLHSDVAQGNLHPKKVKEDLASEMVARFHGADAAKNAREEFEKVFSRKELPDDMKKVSITSRTPLVEFALSQGLAKSKGEFRRLVEQGGVRLNDQRIDHAELLLPAGEHVLRVGKRKFLKIQVGGS